MDDDPHLIRLLVDLTQRFTHAILGVYNLMLKRLAILSLWFALVPPLILAGLFFLATQKQDPRASSLPPLEISELPAENSIEGAVLGIKLEDTRPYLVSKFLKGTPLEEHSQLIVEVSDEYGLDYRLIPAIAMKESGGGAAVDPASHNAWGFENGRTYFDSWEGAIKIVAKTLKKQYIDRGMTTPEEIMAVYAPPQLETGGKWAKDINHFFTQMETL